MKIKFCKKCITTNTRPQIIFDKNGICSACRYHDIFFNQDWEKKRKEFETIVKKIKKNSKGYDILIPVSGGKDSTWQVAMCLKYKMNPLTFSYRPLLRTNIGKKKFKKFD